MEIKQHLLSIIAVCLTSSIILSGCSSANNSAPSGKVSSGNVILGKNGSVEYSHVNKDQNSLANPIFNTTLTLPNGRIVTSNISNGAVRWKDIKVRLEIQSVPNDNLKYPGIVGNHSTILSQTNVSTSAGTATLILNERTPPAADKLTTPTYEYWVIIYKNQYAYCIVATIVGNRGNAKDEVIGLLNNWMVPHLTSPNSAQPGDTMKISGWIAPAPGKDSQLTIMLYRNKEPNSGIDFETSQHSDGIFSTSIPIPSKLPNGDYLILIMDPSKGSNNPVFTEEVYIAPFLNTSKPPKVLPVLNIWADPPLLGTKVKIDGWVPKGTISIKLAINGGRGSIQQVLQVKSNGYFKVDVLLPETLMLTNGKAQFEISGFNNNVLLKKSINVGNPNDTH